MSNKFTFIQTGSADSKKYYVLCSMCMINEEEFKNLVILEKFKIHRFRKIKTN
jgi:formylmethanofuran dehydrogenase subunit D